MKMSDYSRNFFGVINQSSTCDKLTPRMQESILEDA